MEMEPPRTLRISCSGKSSRLRPSSRILPPTTRPGGFGINRRTESAVTLLPQPDSPTTPRVSPLRTVRLTLSTARTVPASVMKWVSRSWISSRISFGDGAVWLMDRPCGCGLEKCGPV